MLVQLPRLANSLREPFDFDQAYLQRKAALGIYFRNTPANSTADSELAQEIVKGLDSTPSEVREAYRHFISSVINLVDGETTSEEFKETALTIYFSPGRSTGSESEKEEEFAERRSGIQNILGRAVSHDSLRTAVSAAHKLFISQYGNSENPTTRENCSRGESEFGADLVFKEPVRFAEDFFPDSVENPVISVDSDSIQRDIVTIAPVHPSSDRTFNLRWLKGVCEQIVVRNTSHFSSDELAMAICQLLDSERQGEEIAGDVLDLAGEAEFEIVQQLIFHRKELVGAIRSGVHTLKSDKTTANPQHKMPSYATQVTVQRESERQMDRLRRKEEKRSKHGSEMAAEAMSFSSLLQASERKSPIENLIGQRGDGDSLQVTALPQGTVRKHHKGYEEVIVPPTPSAALFPDEELIHIKDLDDFAQAAFQGYTSLNRIQSRIFQSTYHTNENILVCAPTGSGKTNIAMLAVLHEMSQHFEDVVGGGRFLRKNEFKVVYVAPMKALAAEVTSAFSRRLLPLNVSVRELTGDMQLSKKELEETQMIVTTPEKWDVITRKSNDMSLSMSVKLLIIDEVHLLNDDRGAVIEALVARTLRQVESTQTMIRIVGLSATLPNHREVAQFLRVNPDAGLFFFDSSYRPVPLAQRYIGITESGFAARTELLNDICYGRVAGSLRQGNQAMVFVHSRKDTAKTAQRLIELARGNEDGDLFRPDAHPRCSLARKEVAAKSRSRELTEYFESAVGIHHAGMPRSDRSLVERLFSDGIIKVLVCTATLAWGVNLPAHTVVIKGTQLYDAKAGGWRDLGMLDVMQIFGRAGRPQFDTSGEGIIITSHAKLAHYLRMLTSQLPIESQFIGSLKDNLNAEVVLGTVTNVKEACAWLGYTYLSIRMRVNPLSYGVSWDDVVADPSLASKQRLLVVDAARALDRARMMRFDEKSGNFYCTELGRIASHYYIHHSSVETYNEILRRNMSDGDVVEMIARSSEFENIAVRDEEQDELEAAAGNRSVCPLDVKGGPTSKHGKVSILIQLYISRASPSSFSLVSDAAYVSASLGRITRALFEICLRRGWSEMSGFLLNYCKAVDRRVWPHQHPLRQLDISPEIAHKLEERNADIDRLGEMSEADVGALIRYGPGGKTVKQCLSFFPKLELSATVSPITRTVLKVDLVIAPVFVWKDRFHGVSARWWIFVEDSENDHVYHSELFVLSKREALSGEPSRVSFVVPIFEPHPAQYYVRAVSDSWMNSESVLDVSFRNLLLPSARHSHTELLDLRPLPVTVLRDESYQSIYGFSHFNPIQTQCFHVLYHTDDNVVVGAPTGSGKTVLAELAMLRLFDAHPGMKAVYVAPLKAIVRERVADWKRRLVGRLGKRMVEVTGDHTPDSAVLSLADIIITTPEKWDGISRGWRHGRSYVSRVGLVILDEVHLLGADRGAILEVIVSRMRYVSSRTERPIRFAGLSTALANPGDLAGWLGVPDSGLFNFKPSVRPVPLEVHIQGYPGKFYCPRMNSMNKPTYAAIAAHSPEKPVLVFVSSRRQTRLTALDLIQFAASDDRPRRFLSIPDDDLEMVISQVSDSSLRHTLRFGIGIHHAGLADRDRSLAEELFSNGKIQVLVSTSTLAWGVNLPCHLVVVKGTEYYDGKARRYADFPITDILQMMGRAGRPQYDRHGKAVILVHEPKKSFYKKFLYEPFPVESSLPGHLHDHFNAEIVSGVIRTRDDAANYLTWTYLYFRIAANPAYYGLESSDPDAVRRYLSGLVEETFRDLEDSECVRFDGDRAEPTALGHVAARYYLSYVTVSMFGSNISSDVPPDLLLLILSGASEYDELPVRHNEENYNALLADKARYPVDSARLDDPHVKANLLLQSHFSWLELPVSDYVTDLKSVLDQSVRIVQAMVDVSANSGWLSTALSCMRLLQMLMQGLWLDDDLWMLPMMTSDVSRVLDGKGLSHVSGLLELSESDLQSAVGETVTGSRLYQELRHYPRIRVHLSVREGSDGGDVGSSLHVRLESIGRRDRGSSKAYLPRFPKHKDEGWWLVLTRTVSSVDELCALRRVSFSDRNVVGASLDLPGPSVVGMNLVLVSDCYIGFEQVHPLPRPPQGC